MNGLCRAAGVSRAGYYRFLVRAQPQEVAMDLRSQIQRIALRWPAYGYRRVHAELRAARLDGESQTHSAADASR